MFTFSDNFCLNEVERLMPKVTITNIPIDVTDETLVTKFCGNVAYLNIEINNDDTFQ